MLTLPKVVKRPKQAYVAIREKVKIPFGKAVDRVMPELFSQLGAQGIEPAGPVFFKLNIVDMPRLEMEFGVPVGPRAKGSGRLIHGVLPAGRYAEVRYVGHYKNLLDVNAVLIGWAKERGLQWDSVTEPDGEHFAARFETYPNGPQDEPDPDKWETILRIKLRD